MADKQFNQTIPIAPKQEMYLHVIDKDNGKDGYIDQQAYEEYMVSTAPEGDNFVDYPRGEYTGVSTSNVVAFQNPSTEDYGGISISELKRMMIDATYPVGTVYENENDSRNPFEYFGVGTWVAWGGGKCVLGVGEGSDINAVNLAVSQGQTGGEYLHTLTEAEIAKHDHDASISPNPHRHGIYGASGGDGGFTINDGTSNTAGYTGYQSLTVNVQEQDIGDQAHNNIQPYVSAYRWRRIS